MINIDENIDENVNNINIIFLNKENNDENILSTFINNEKIDLEPGDALVYDGVNNEHWGDCYEGDYYAQMFLHYVYADGKHKDYYRDKRPAFGMNK